MTAYDRMLGHVVTFARMDRRAGRRCQWKQLVAIAIHQERVVIGEPWRYLELAADLERDARRRLDRERIAPRPRAPKAPPDPERDRPWRRAIPPPRWAAHPDPVGLGIPEDGHRPALAMIAATRALMDAGRGSVSQRIPPRPRPAPVVLGARIVSRAAHVALSDRLRVSRCECCDEPIAEDRAMPAAPPPPARVRAWDMLLTLNTRRL